MTTVCQSRATHTSARVVTSYVVATTTRNVVSTSPAHVSLIPYTTTTCSVRQPSEACVTYGVRSSTVPYTTTICTVRPASSVCSSIRTSRTTRSSIVPYTTTICNVRPASSICATSRTSRISLVPYQITTCSASRVCSTIRTSRPTTIPARVYTTPVRYYSSRAVYYTSRVTLYSTSCSVSPRPAVGSTPAPPSTSYVTTTATEILDPTTTTTDTLEFTDTATATETSISTLPDGSTDTPVPLLPGADTAGPRGFPIGAIVGGVLGGLVAAALLGLLIHSTLFNFKKVKVYDPGNSRNPQRQQPISLIAIDGQSSPSEGSSGAFNPQLQEYGTQYANGHEGQDMQYNMTIQEADNIHRHSRRLTRRRDSANQLGQDTMAVPAAANPLSPGSEQGYFYSQPLPGQYVGYAEIQDSRL